MYVMFDDVEWRVKRPLLWAWAHQDGLITKDPFVKKLSEAIIPFQTSSNIAYMSEINNTILRPNLV